MRILFFVLLVAGANTLFAQSKQEKITTVPDLEKLNSSQYPNKVEIELLDSGETIDIRVGKEEHPIDFSFCTFYHPFRMSVKFFHNAIFQGETKFLGPADFSYSKFSDSLVFVTTDFYNEVNFKHCLLPKAIRFNKVDFKGDAKVDFSGSRLQTEGVKCRLVIKETDLANMVLPYDLFEFEFREPTNEEKQEQAYEVTIKNCRDAGMIESAQKWDIDLQKLRNERRMGAFLGGIFNFLNEVWWNFGYAKGRIFWLWMWVFFAIFYCINFLFLPGLLKAYDDEEVGRSFREGHDTLSQTLRLHRLMYTLAFTAFIYFNFRLTTSAMNFTYPWRMIYIFIVYCVGTLHVVLGVGTTIFQ